MEGGLSDDNRTDRNCKMVNGIVLVLSLIKRYCIGILSPGRRYVQYQTLISYLFFYFYSNLSSEKVDFKAISGKSFYLYSNIDYLSFV